MPLIQYVEKKFHPKTEDEIAKVNSILDEYEKQGFDLTVRQIYYQFVSRDWIKNTLKEYKRLASIINDARMAGLIDWDKIVDRTRFLRSLNHWSDPASIIDACASSYREDIWKDQPCRIEVWIEKDALVGVIEKVCNSHQIPFFSCRGYTSQSEMWGAAQRLSGYYDGGNGQEVHIIHLGDHDPSGIDMTRDIMDRMDLFIHPEAVHMHRIALNMDQVQKYNPPANPAKLTDSRCHGYIKKHGRSSWELDALKPTIIATLITNQIDELIDAKAWNRSLAKQKEGKEQLQHVSSLWERVVGAVNKWRKE